MYYTTNSTFSRRYLLQILHITQIQATGVSSLHKVIGNSLSAGINNVSHVNQVSGYSSIFYRQLIQEAQLPLRNRASAMHLFVAKSLCIAVVTYNCV